MKKVYTAFIPLFFLLISACKKQKIDTYDKRLMGGTWELYKVDAPYYFNPPYVNGFFAFKPEGWFEYTNINGNTYYGRWSSHYHNDTQRQTLIISVNNMTIHPTTGEVFDDIRFTDANHFIGYIYWMNTTDSFHFKR